jgi:hypothetical protein
VQRPRIRTAALIAAPAALLLFSGCGSGERASATPKLAPAAPKPPRQLLLAVPKLGRLTGSCKPYSTFRLTYTGDRDRGEYIVVRVRGKVVVRQVLNPPRSVSFSAKVHHRRRDQRTLDESDRISITTTTSHEPFEARSVARFKLIDAMDETGECLLESAVVRSSAHLH